LWKLGVRYAHGKVLIYPNNPSLGLAEAPGWAVDIREIIAMGFVGVAGLCFIFKGEYQNAMILFTGLLAYATGRTVPGRPQPKGE